MVKTKKIRPSNKGKNKHLKKPRSKKHRGGNNDSDLINGATTGDIEMVKNALTEGANVNAKDSDSNTALYTASRRGHTEIVKILLDNGAKVNVKDNNGWTALITASKRGLTEIVKILLENGANVNSKDNNGWTALILASGDEGHPKIVKILLDNGANVNAKDSDSNTALYLASRHGQTEIVKILLDNGADVNVEDIYGDTAVTVARIFGHTEIVELIENRGGNLDTQFMNAIKEDNLSYVEDNIGNITDLSFENSSGNTPLDIAITKYNELKTTEFMGDDEREMELYSIRTQIIIALLKNGANGENIELPGINFNNVELKNVNLRGSDLTGATLEYANLDGANLTDANLSGADLQDTIITNATLTNTKFIEANMDGTNINGSNTNGADFTGTILDTPPTSDTVFRTTTDYLQTFDESVANINTNVNYNEDDMSDIEVDPSETNNISFDDNQYLDLMDSDATTQHRETERERNSRLQEERKNKKQNYLERSKITLDTNNTDPFKTVGLSGYNAIMMEDVSFCEYINKSNDNVIFIHERQVGLLDKPSIKTLITNETLDETKIVYQCNELSEAFIPYEENIISGPMLNMHIMGMFGLMLPLEDLDEVVNGTQQIFVIKTESDQDKIPIASLPTRLATGAESGAAVVGANHCQSEVSIKVGKLSFVEDQVLLKQCDKKGGKKQKTRRKKQKKSKRSPKTRKNKNKKSKH